MTVQPSGSMHGLYVIVDTQAMAGRPFDKTVEQVLLGGARILQYRDKTSENARRLDQARILSTLCHRYAATLFINDDPELAVAVDAQGVHLGRQDTPVAHVRAAFPQLLVGASCYNSLERARRNVADGAAYVAFGSFFPSPTKPQAIRAEADLLTRARQEFDVPLVAIGGIMADNARGLIESGADAVAVISAVLKADDPQRASREIADMFGAG
jgi:thiamine-phosphate pyrophosphorylase